MAVHQIISARATGHLPTRGALLKSVYEYGKIRSSLCVKACIYHILPTIILLLQITQLVRQKWTDAEDVPTRSAAHRWRAQHATSSIIDTPTLGYHQGLCYKAFSGATTRRWSIIPTEPAVLDLFCEVFSHRNSVLSIKIRIEAIGDLTQNRYHSQISKQGLLLRARKMNFELSKSTT